MPISIRLVRKQGCCCFNKKDGRVSLLGGVLVSPRDRGLLIAEPVRSVFGAGVGPIGIAAADDGVIAEDGFAHGRFFLIQAGGEGEERKTI